MIKVTVPCFVCIPYTLSPRRLRYTNESPNPGFTPLNPPLQRGEISGSPPLQGGVRGGEKDLYTHRSLEGERL